MRSNIIYTLTICAFLPMLSYGQKVEGENFTSFIEKFSSDSIFQISRVSFPLKLVYLNDESFTIDTAYIVEDRYVVKNGFYNSLRGCLEAYPVVYDNFACKSSISDERVFTWKGFTGMDERFYFRRIYGKWYLVKISSIGT